MIKKMFFIILLVLSNIQAVSAEKIPVKITPVQIISTHHDEIELGDKINFVVVKDVYVNEKLYIPKDADIVGIVDFIHPNGWCGDSAEIVFKDFYIKDKKDKENIIVHSNLIVNGNSEMANETRNVLASRTSSFLVYLTNFSHFAFVFRGSEIFVEPDTKIYNIFIEQ